MVAPIVPEGHSGSGDDLLIQSLSIGIRLASRATGPVAVVLTAVFVTLRHLSADADRDPSRWTDVPDSGACGRH